MQDDDKLTVRQFLDLLERSPQMEDLALAQDVVRVDDMLIAFSQVDKEPQPISLPHLRNLRLFDYHSPITLNLTLRLLHAPNVEEILLTNLDTDEDLNPVDFSETFEFLGEGGFSSFSHLKALELRRVSCDSKEAWKSLSKLLTKLQFLSLTYVGNRLHGPDDDSCSELLSVLLPEEPSPLSSPDETLSTSKALCPALKELGVSGCHDDALVEFLKRRSKSGHGPTLVTFGGNKGPSNDVVGELAKMGVKFTWSYDTNSEDGGEADDDL
ncbi:hypothetical protein FS837_000309 [Tulasnella sp. UAMH 9824]|nr:hypothetical protein FS837_000309 [Tulasnella sp. UAMH 9824]